MEGRFREASQRWSRGGARGRAVRAARTREAKGHRPGPTTRAPPSVAGRGQGERSESSALGKWNPTPPGTRKHGPDSPKSPRWSAERRGILRQDAAAFRKGAELGAPFGAPPPPLYA